MVKKIWLAGMAAAALMGSTALAHAQDDDGSAGMDDKPGMHGGMDDGGDGGMMGGRFGGRLKEKLGLTDDQAAKLKDFFKKQREDNTPLRDQMRIDMDTLRQKVDTKAPDSEIKKLLDKLSEDQKGMQAARERTKDQLREILTPTQQAKMLFMMHRGRGRMGMWRDHGDWKGKGDWKKDGHKKGPKGDDSGSGTGPNATPPDVNN